MKDVRLPLALSGSAIACILFLLLLNEGVFSIFKPAGPSHPPQVLVARASCPDLAMPPNSALPFVILLADDSPVHYFSSSIDGEARVSFTGGSFDGLKEWNFFSNCQRYEIDLSALSPASLTRAGVHVYNRDILTSPAATLTIAPEIRPAKVEARGNSRYTVEFTEAGRIASLSLYIDDLYFRLGPNEFGYVALPHFRLLQSRHGLGDQLPLGGAFGQLVATGSSQRVLNQNDRFLNSPASQFISANFQNINRSLSILMSTLLGVFVGAMFESILAQRTIKELQRGAAATATDVIPLDGRDRRDNDNAPTGFMITILTLFLVLSIGAIAFTFFKKLAAERLSRRREPSSRLTVQSRQPRSHDD